MSVETLQSKDKNAAEKLYQMDNTVDALYKKYLREAIMPHEKTDKRFTDPRCYISALLILRYLERISTMPATSATRCIILSQAS